MISVTSLILAVPAAQADGSSNTAGLTGVAHRSVPLHLTDGTASPEGRDRQAYPLRYASATGSSVVERGGDCTSAREAVVFYRQRTWERQRARGGRLATRTPIVAGKSCHWARYAARTWSARATASRLALERWWRRHPKLAGETPWDVSMRNPVNRNLWRLAVCETGGINGGEPLWSHHNSVYSGALGFAHSTWAHWRHFVKPLPPAVAAHASAVEQLAVGRALVRTFGGYSSWPACHRRLGLG